MEKIDSVIKEVLNEINPPKEELEFIEKNLSKFLKKTKERIKKLKIDAEVFVGGSYAKGTLTKGEFYDVDIFLRFSKKYSEEEYTRLSKKILRWTKRVSVVHGSRNYFRIKLNEKVHFEVVPVKKIRTQKEAVNITDLSYFHVKYLKKKIKKQKVLEEIKLGKAFLRGIKVYGAESYVHGFSGYSVELLIYHFKTFKKFLKVLSKKRKEKLIIDIEDFYKNGDVLLDMNGSKLDSPIVLVDPTYKIRNVLAALSEETYLKFQEYAKKFLKRPTKDFFVSKPLDFEEEKKKAKKKNLEFVKLKIKTKKEMGDVAGTKLLKFFNHLSNELNKYFEVKENDFEYGGKKEGEGFLSLKSRGELVLSGPRINNKENLEKFQKEHKLTYVKGKRIYAREIVNASSHEFIKKWLNKNKKKVRDMGITEVRVY